MSNIAIKAEKLSKLYRIGGPQEKYKTLRDVVADILSSPLRQLSSVIGNSNSKPQNTFWALKDVSFEIQKGAVTGIIGRNGAGKSTLLKILSRITEPTSGYAEIRGRVRSLLEVGTGFHQELTGRENILLNGAILGMKKTEIDRKFDEIIDFAEIEKFIDTPVKHYSSGMYVRLAFAVAAHLEPEILLVDEVLAVGDAGFQKKCLGKMSEVSREGRTVLFVSHNMQAIRNLCSRSIFLNEGTIISDAPTEKSLNFYNQYLRKINIDDKTAINNESNRRGGGTIRFTSVSIQDVHGNERFNFEMGEIVRFKMSFKTFKEMQGLVVDIVLRSGVTRDFVTSVKYPISSKKI